MNNPMLSLPMLLGQLGNMLPAMIVALTVLAVMVAIAIKRSHFIIATLSVIGLNLALFAVVLQMQGVIGGEFTPNLLFVFDGFANVNIAVVLVCALACCSLSYGYFETLNDNKEELYLLLLVSTLGAVLMAAAQHLASFFVALELLSVPMYGMLAYAFLKQKSLESGIKYLVLSATASATLLMGMAFIFADTGSLDFAKIGEVILTQQGMVSPWLVAGGIMLLVAIAFKLSIAPFHAWAGDVYEGAPAPITAFLASAAKVAVVALAIRFFVSSAMPLLPSVDTVLTWLIVLSILVGNLLALKQENLKRLFAYSSIAHMGYVMIALISVGTAADGLTTMYMAVYALSSLAAFGVISIVTGTYRNEQYADNEADKLSYYQGMFWQRPMLTAVMTVTILSMAGIPLTAGFITKFQVVFAAVQGGRFGLALMLIVGSAIGLYYYLKVLLIMFKRPTEEDRFKITPNWGTKVGGIMVLLITLLIFGLGVLPNFLLVLAGKAIIG